MKDIVLKRWISVVALVASMSVVWALIIPYGLPWTGLVWVTALGLFAMSAALWVGMSVPIPVPGSVNRLKGAGPR